MTISTTRTSPCIGGPRAAGLWRAAGFTLPEVVIGASLGAIVLAGILSAFLMLGRSGVNVASYSASETAIRRALEEFGQDVRMASDVVWNSSSSVTLTVPNNYAAYGNKVTYAYDNATSGATALSFYRLPGLATSGAAKSILVRDVSDFAFARYNRLDGSAASDRETKRLQISMNVRRTGQTVVAANTSAVSASYVLRNKVAR